MYRPSFDLTNDSGMNATSALPVDAYCFVCETFDPYTTLGSRTDQMFSLRSASTLALPYGARSGLAIAIVLTSGAAMSSMRLIVARVDWGIQMTSRPRA